VFQTSLDALYIHRFNRDTLGYSQTRVGWLAGPVQPYWNLNLTADVHREPWANFGETGPGIRIAAMKSWWLSVDALKGQYFVRAGNPQPLNFYDMRAGLWYAFHY
jgi:hypothetical protein